MSRIFITGSADGLGRLAAEKLVAAGHRVVLHARSEKRAAEAKALVPQAEDVLIADVETLQAMERLAADVNRLGPFDAVIHNVAIGYKEPQRLTADGIPHVFAINSLAPYVLTALIAPPKRLVYLSSDLHRHADHSLHDMLFKERRWSGLAAYSESKFHNALLAFAVARLWPQVFANAMEPGWVPTKMGGPSAPDDLDQGCETQAWLATSDEPYAKVAGEYFFHKRPQEPAPATHDKTKQEQFLAFCAKLSGISLKA